MYFVYLDEFGHDGAFVQRDHPRFKTSPVFGFAGLALPAEAVREFSSFFYALKKRLLAYEIAKSRKQAYAYEMKGSSLLRAKNISTYSSARQAVNRLLNKLEELGGFVVYDGMAKTYTPEKHNENRMYAHATQSILKGLNTYCEKESEQFFVVLDQIDDGKRKSVVERSGVLMFGKEQCKALMEHPVQVESHLYQNIQCADWLCALVNKLMTYRYDRVQFADHALYEQYFGQRLEAVQRASSCIFPNHDRCTIISRPEAL